MELGRSQAGQASRAQREADLAALQARGMGGSGATQAAMLSANQGFTQSMADADLQMQIEAQRRALQAMTTAGSVAGQARGQSLQEGNAANEFNQWATQRQQDWVGRNTATRNATRESTVGARREVYGNERDAVDALSGRDRVEADRDEDRRSGYADKQLGMAKDTARAGGTLAGG
jgi:hypothetical protein